MWGEKGRGGREGEVGLKGEEGRRRSLGAEFIFVLGD